MRKPTQMDAFDALYAIAAADGREEALFGSSVELARAVYERTLIGDGYPSAYLEFPLLGEPCFDILSVHAHVQPGARFAPGAGFGRQAMFDWFAGVCSGEGEGAAGGAGAAAAEGAGAAAAESSDAAADGGASAGDVSCGLELDTSSGETEAAGVYLQFRDRPELAASFLESIGEGVRTGGFQDAIARMPEGWPPAYVGLFPGRPGTPLRIGGYLGREAQAACTADPAHLADHFRQIGFTAFDGPMLERCAEFMALAPAVDFQFDIMADGSLGDTFGLSLSFNETKPRQARECMEDGYGARICETLERWGLADDRWRRIAGAAFARHIAIERDDGAQGRFALCVLFNYAKVKFTACEPRPAKFYLILAASELAV